MAKKQKEDDAINETLRDWKLLAQKVDFILFWIFLALTTVTRDTSLKTFFDCSRCFRRNKLECLSVDDISAHQLNDK